MQWNQSGSGTHTLSNPDQCQGKEGNDLKQRHGGIKIQKKAGADTKPKQTKTQKEHSSKWKKKERLNLFPACEPMSFQHVFLLVECIKPFLLA